MSTSRSRHELSACFDHKKFAAVKEKINRYKRENNKQQNLLMIFLKVSSYAICCCSITNTVISLVAQKVN